MQLFVLLALLGMTYLASVNATKATTIQFFDGITCTGEPVATNILSLISCSTGRSGSVSFACGAFEEFFKPNCQGNALGLANFSNFCIPDISTNQSHIIGCSNLNNLVNITVFEAQGCKAESYSTLVQPNVCQGSTGSTFNAFTDSLIEIHFNQSWKLQLSGNTITADFFENSGTCSGNPSSTFSVSDSGSCSSSSSSGAQTLSITAKKLGSSGIVAKLSATLIVALITVCMFVLWAGSSYRMNLLQLLIKFIKLSFLNLAFLCMINTANTTLC